MASMSISSLVAKDTAPTTLEECTVLAPVAGAAGAQGAPEAAERAQYMAAQLARFEALEQWETLASHEHAQNIRVHMGARFARNAEAAAVQAYRLLEPRAASRAQKLERKPARASARTAAKPIAKRKLESIEEKPVKVARTAAAASSRTRAPATDKQHTSTYEGIWRDIARKEIAKVYKLQQNVVVARSTNDKKTALLASKESRKWQSRTSRLLKDMQSKARRAMREMMGHWKKSEKEVKSQRRAAEKEKIESAKKEEEERESARQARKLNFLISQTELYSHFVTKTGEEVGDEDAEGNPYLEPNASMEFDNDEQMLAAARATAAKAMRATRERAAAFDGEEGDAQGASAQGASAQGASAQGASAPGAAKGTPAPSAAPAPSADGELDFQNPSTGDISIEQPTMLTCKLKEYQLKGLNWLANLYEQGINGILADDMGLGKTVQSISVLAYLAEHHNIWGPYLVIAPASTLHNWQQEISKFVPEFKVLPYWGGLNDRKVLRKFWDRTTLRYTRDSPFHVLVTSYQLVVSDAQYLNRIKWQYMILDEAQAIKSSNTSRWKSLLAMQCRNRLLLTGTPIQNSMQELWALLHFIMPTLFDSHEEFSDWFSKDIESHATKNSTLNEAQLKRLHMILKPFMLRRVKKNVQRELGDKIEKDIMCPLTHRQRAMYQALKSQVHLADLANEDSANLMNLVMQFRKVCNHPDLFERTDVQSPFVCGSFGAVGARPAKDPSLLECDYTLRSVVEQRVPKLFVDVGGVVGAQSSLPPSLSSIYDPESPAIAALSAASGTPSGRICALARQGLYERALGLYELSPTERKFLVEPLDSWRLAPSVHPRVMAPPAELVASDRAHFLGQRRALFPAERRALAKLTLNQELALLRSGAPFPPSNLYPETRSQIAVPSMTRFIQESGKMAQLDKLLPELKAGGHRVLIYFQMTRMMDLMGEYLAYRQHKFLRLDGNSKLGDRRDLVNDWQTRPDLFVFMLSTRAGGLGINLTAADTVIFYDSDWNPTMDSQAMDRAHRLGQTRQVTVYRLLVKGTIEERMRDRAKQKEHVQQVVMEGGQGAGADFQKPGGKEVASWLMED